MSIGKLMTSLRIILFINGVACLPEITYLGYTYRIQNHRLVDYFFYCKGIGSFLNWQENNFTPLRGFTSNSDIMKPISISLQNMKVTASLLSAKHIAGQQYQMESLLVLSIPRSEREGVKEVQCHTNNSGIISAVNTSMSKETFNSSIKSNYTSYIDMDYIFSSRNNTINVLICRTNFSQLFVEVNSPKITFALDQSIFMSQTVLSRLDNSTVSVQGIVMSNGPFLTSLVIIKHFHDIDVKCLINDSITASIAIKGETIPTPISFSTSYDILHGSTTDFEDKDQNPVWIEVVVILVIIVLVSFICVIPMVLILPAYKKMTKKNVARTSLLLKFTNNETPTNEPPSVQVSSSNGEDLSSKNEKVTNGESDFAKPLNLVENNEGTRQRRTAEEVPSNEQLLRTPYTQDFPEGGNIDTVDPPMETQFNSQAYNDEKESTTQSGDEF